MGNPERPMPGKGIRSSPSYGFAEASQLKGSVIQGKITIDTAQLMMNEFAKNPTSDTCPYVRELSGFPFVQRYQCGWSDKRRERSTQSQGRLGVNRRFGAFIKKVPRNESSDKEFTREKLKTAIELFSLQEDSRSDIFIRHKQHQY